jgi:hypothetical protein
MHLKLTLLERIDKSLIAFRPHIYSPIDVVQVTSWCLALLQFSMVGDERRIANWIIIT